MVLSWFFFTETMIRRFKLVNFCYRSLQFHDKCRVLSNALSTSSVCDNRNLTKSKINNVKQEIIHKNKTKYEDTFGDIDSFEQMFDRIKDDPEDILEYERDKAALGKTIGQYIKEIKQHLDNRDYQGALKVLEVDMVNDRKPLNRLVYKILISYNAKIGNLEEAYRLFIKFKRRQGIVTGAMYTSMFNACANCQNSLLALEKANSVEECMRKNKRHSINISNYNVMLKAYGRHGDLPKCLKIMDEVLERRDKIQACTYSFLLQACISDRNSGLRHAFIVWRKMLQNRIKPDVFLFNLLLRCIRQCSLGDALLIPKLIDDIKQDSGKFFRRKVIIKTVRGEKKRKVLKIPASGDHLVTPVDKASKTPEKNTQDFIQSINIESSLVAVEESQSTSQVSQTEQEISQMEMDSLGNQSNNLVFSSNENDTSGSVENFSNPESCFEVFEKNKDVSDPIIELNNSELPNFIALRPSTGSIIEFGVLKKPQHRFMLVGGTKGFLMTMKEFSVQPDIKTFTLMLELIPSTVESEEELMSLAEASKVRVDTGFFNVLIKRRFFRDDSVSVTDCLEKMYSLNIKPDIITFGVLSLGCKTCELGKDLLNVLQSHGFRANTEILETLLRQAQRARDMNYVLAILQAAKESETQLGHKFLAKLTRLVNKEKYLRMKEAKEKLLKSGEAPDSLPSS